MGPSIWQLLIVLMVALLVFGAGKIPVLMRDLGLGIKNFRTALNEKNTDNDHEINKEKK